MTNIWFNIVVPHEQEWKRQTWKHLLRDILITPDWAQQWRHKTRTTFELITEHHPSSSSRMKLVGSTCVCTRYKRNPRGHALLYRLLVASNQIITLHCTMYEPRANTASTWFNTRVEDMNLSNNILLQTPQLKREEEGFHYDGFREHHGAAFTTDQLFSGRLLHHSVILVSLCNL